MTNDVQGLIRAIEKAHACKAVHLASVPVKETFRGRTVWEGVVEEFTIQHPDAQRCYGWTYEEAGEIQYATVLGKSPIDSARKAVQSYIASEVRGRK